MERIGRKFRFLLISFLWLFWIGALASCGKVAGKGPTSAAAPAAAKEGKLYIANQGDGSVLAFDRATSAEGNISPSRRFPDILTGPTGIFLDHATDTLYVANTDHNEILIFENASKLNPPLGLAAASRVISGALTGLDHPYGVAYDAARGRLYVSNKNSNSILVFQADCPTPNTLNGNIAPCRTLSGVATLLDFPRSLAVDTQRDILYISNLGTNSILVYDNASQSTTQGNLAPSRTIVSHADPTQIESMLSLPWGIFSDSANDRLYVIKLGGNQPAILIYENASVRSGGTIPERLVIGLDTKLSEPAGLDVAVAQDRMYVINNNNTNNGSVGVLVFANITSRCTATIHLCDLVPDRTIVGDKTGLTGPSGIAYDPENEMIYIANTLGNNILIFILNGNISPSQLNAGTTIRPTDTVGLEAPDDFYYDKTLDRFYIINNRYPSEPKIIVYDQISGKLFSRTPPSWSMVAGRDQTNQEDFSFPRGIYLDKTRGYLLVLSTYIQTGLLVYRLSDIPNFPINSSAGPTGATVTLPPPATIGSPPGAPRFTDGLTLNDAIGNGPTAMAVDEGRGDVYIADAGTNSVVVYNINSLSNSSASRVITGFNHPSGVFIDTTRDILYVTNIGGASNVDPNIGNTVFVYDNASARSGATAPNRIISSSTSFAASDRLSAPTAPFVNTEADRLFLVDWGQNAIFIFNHASVRSGATQPDRKLAGSQTLFAFTSTGDSRQTYSAALWVDTNAGNETLYVGQPKDPTCDPTVPLDCPKGAFLIFTIVGNVSPGRIWSGGSAPLAGPSAIAVDTTKDILYVANQGDPAAGADDSLFAFSNASMAQGNISSHRTLCSPVGTTCFSPDTKFNNPAGLFVDPNQNRLYLSNSGTDCSNAAAPCNAILVFHNADVLDNDAIPNLTLSSPDLNSPHGLTVDLTRKTLYVANTGGQSVLIFKNIDGLNGNVSIGADAEIGGVQSKINQPVGVAVDSARDLLYVLNQGIPEILVFERASAQNGNAAPARVISGSNLLNKPSALFLDPDNDLLYVADQGGNAVYIFTGASAAQGQADHKTLKGDNTGLNQPITLFVDPTR